MNVLVIGGSGRIGGYVLRELRDHGHTVTSFGRTPPVINKVGHETGDVLDLESVRIACRNIDVVVHLSVGYPGRVTTEQLMQTNVMGTFHVLEAAVAQNVKKVVIASSEAVYGFSYQRRPLLPRYLPVDEEHPCEPQDEYGLSKRICELMCRRYSFVYGLKTICLRISAAWYVDRKGAEFAVCSGPLKRTPMTVEQLWALYREEIERPEGPFLVPGPAPAKNRLFVVTDARDAAQAFRLAVENTTIDHGVYLICGDDTCSTESTTALINRYYPTVPLHAPLPGYASLFSHEQATRELGYRPRHSWRCGNFAEWFEKQRRSTEIKDNESCRINTETAS